MPDLVISCTLHYCYREQ